MTFQDILFSRKNEIGVLTLNNPKKANALSKRMINELIDALTAISDDESVKVIILKAAGRHFCAGHDLREMLGQGVGAYKKIFDQCTQMMQLLHEIPQPVIAQVFDQPFSTIRRSRISGNVKSETCSSPS